MLNASFGPDILVWSSLLFQPHSQLLCPRLWALSWGYDGEQNQPPLTPFWPPQASCFFPRCPPPNMLIFAWRSLHTPLPLCEMSLSSFCTRLSPAHPSGLSFILTFSKTLTPSSLQLPCYFLSQPPVCFSPLHARSVRRLEGLFHLEDSKLSNHWSHACFFQHWVPST